MSRIKDERSKGLHNEDGSHVATSPSTRGDRIALHERQLKRHMSRHIAEMEKATGEIAWVCGGCLEATVETHYREGVDGVVVHAGAGALTSDETKVLQNFSAPQISVPETSP